MLILNTPKISLISKIFLLIRKKANSFYIESVELITLLLSNLNGEAVLDKDILVDKWTRLGEKHSRLVWIDRFFLNFLRIYRPISSFDEYLDLLEKKEELCELKGKVDSALLKVKERLCDFSDYFTHYQAKVMKESYIELSKSFPDHFEYKYLPVARELEEAVKEIENIFIDFPDRVKSFNEEYIKNELIDYKSYFDNYEKGLNSEQRKAVVLEENKVLVNAGAGSGKTSVISARIGHLVKNKGVDPRDILLVTFSKDGKINMEKRVKEKAEINIEARTIHSLGGKIITSYEGARPKLAKEDEARGYLREAYDDLLKGSDLAKRIREFFLNFYYDAKFMFDYNSIEELINHRNEINDFNAAMYSIHSKRNFKPGKSIKTLNNIRVRSFEEKTIADFLFLNNVKFYYEMQYRFPENTKKRFKYQPDFYLPDYDIYIEHFGVDRNGNVPSWFKSTHKKFTAKEVYNYGIRKKKELHKENGTKLVCTYSYEFREKRVLEDLVKKLEDHGVTLKPIDDVESIKFIQPDIIRLLSNFMNLFKSGNYSENDIDNKINDVFGESTFLQRRSRAFLDIFLPFYYRYQEILDTYDKIDFSDYIKKAFEYLNEKGEILTEDYKHIIIDEFQDTSFGMMKLVNALDDLAKDKRLFFVGDDWQSIYKFNGADVTLMLNFDEMNEDSRVTRLEYNYRSQSNIVNLGKMFVSKNPFQLEKDVKSFKSENEALNNPKEIVFLGSKQFEEALINLNSKLYPNGRDDFDNGSVDIYLISRYNNDISIVSDVLTPLKKKQYRYKNLKIRSMAVHSSKGLEAPYVFVLPPKKVIMGFPSSIPDDSVMKLVTSHRENYENAEERRLMYVAMTRAEEQLFFITDNGQEDTNSPFWLEIKKIVKENKMNKDTEPFPLSESLEDSQKKKVEDMKVSQVVSLYVDLFEGYKGKCPFHADEEESLIVKNQNDTFYCPTCKAYGDKYEFVRRLFDLETKLEVIEVIYEDAFSKN
ncbi:UvrD-helicase domain-containing protein [Bacteriovorax sp. Seq25_V]|uniref:UvrD-helicase domain-containing protein n=1 Tax=Bacteriovorax sp. Seq25_V TaxID=1201288 RepID=UPI000389F4FE|nr:UvrD-helicase domain-containing protein [Bacteriovorax sp. Seq25_V]EQC47402.1 UvrD/REP helicase N-terminal domain protein [Bacteriovorax sp. Seq25_V]